MNKQITVFFTFVGCNEDENKPYEAVKTVENAEAKYYSMNLSDISGYEKYVVENGTLGETYDVIISLAKLEANDVKRTALYHKAEDLLMSTGCIITIYFYTDIFMIKDYLTKFFGTATGSKFFKYTKVNNATEKVNVSLASEPYTIDPALNSSVDGVTMILHAFSGLVRYDKNGKLVADLAKELSSLVVNEDESVTYTFELRDGLKWSDGSDLTAADYGYLFEIVSGYVDGTLKVESLEEGKKFAVTLPVNVPYFLNYVYFLHLCLLNNLLLKQKLIHGQQFQVLMCQVVLMY